MTEQDSVILSYLRRILEQIEATREDVREITTCIIRIEEKLGNMIDGLGRIEMRLTGIETRLDRIDLRLNRIDRRLDIAEA